jgi:uncharacterized protein (TIGR00369 family)
MTDELPIVLLHGSATGSYSWAAVRMGVVQGIDYLEPLESFRTTSLSVNFFRPVWEARLCAEAHVVRRGKNLGYVECDIADQDGKQIAKANCSCFVLRGEHAKQR